MRIQLALGQGRLQRGRYRCVRGINVTAIGRAMWLRAGGYSRRELKEMPGGLRLNTPNTEPRERKENGFGHARMIADLRQLHPAEPEDFGRACGTMHSHGNPG
jgi:hypothetical protein